MNTPLRLIRKKQGKTLLEVAQAIGWDTGNLSRVERGRSTSPVMAEKLSCYYNGKVSELEILYPRRYTKSKAS